MVMRASGPRNTIQELAAKTLVFRAEFPLKGKCYSNVTEK